MSDDRSELAAQMQAQFAQLPKVVQNAITSAEVEQHLRGLADTHKLHLDQWEKLENEVMLALMGIQPVEDLQANIQKEVGVPADVAAAVAADISRSVFEPIRQELERGLEHPEAHAKEMSGVEATRETELKKAATAENAGTPPVSPATPPSPSGGEKVVRAPASSSYRSGEASTVRKDIHDDPYREPPA